MSRFSIDEVRKWHREDIGQPAVNFNIMLNGAELIDAIRTKIGRPATHVQQTVEGIQSGVILEYLGLDASINTSVLGATTSGTFHMGDFTQSVHINDRYGAGVSQRAAGLLDETGQKELAALIEEAVANHYGLELGQDVNLLAQQARTRQAERSGQEQ